MDDGRTTVASGELPLILLSGMGADERVFAPQKAAFPKLIVPRWIEPHTNESLADYARRLARVVDPGGPCVVGGASFGGFVAMEMARHLQARACVLIGSARSPAELPVRIRALRALAPLCRWVPFEVVTRLVGVAADVCGGLSAPATRQFARQVATADAGFLRWATRAVLTWRPSGGPAAPRIFHIHGSRDRTLPARRVRPDVLIDGGGHVITLTHPADVNEFLRDCLCRCERG
jgi:pimeloyl-ACP methyl ester carboxylesterase